MYVAGSPASVQSRLSKGVFILINTVPLSLTAVLVDCVYNRFIFPVHITSSHIVQGLPA